MFQNRGRSLNSSARVWVTAKAFVFLCLRRGPKHEGKPSVFLWIFNTDTPWLYITLTPAYEVDISSLSYIVRESIHLAASTGHKPRSSSSLVTLRQLLTLPQSLQLFFIKFSLLTIFEGCLGPCGGHRDEEAQISTQVPMSL